MKTNKKILIGIGILGLVVVAGLVYVSLWMIFPITPTDVKIVSVLEENEELLLSIDGVVGAGIARDEFNHITGIAVYIEDTADVQKIPKKLGEFNVTVKEIRKLSEFEKERMIIRKQMTLPSPSKEPTVKVDDTGWTSKGVNAVVNANNQFAFDLYSQFKKEHKDENIFFSPYSIFVALTMTYEGARGQTAEEMQSVLHIPKDTNLRRSNFARIINEINKPDKKYKLLTANALWVQKDYKFLKEYISTVERYYGGKVTNLDFIDLGEREKSRQVINTWVEEQTNNKIKDLISPGVLNHLTRLVLTNAIYFKGKWVLQFDPKDTKDEDFTTSTGQTVKVPMMRLIGEGAEFNYTETDEIQILEMPYESEDLSMLILLPKENKLDDLEKSITPKKLSEWRNMLNKQRVDIYIPKFKLETKYFMIDALKEMGMPTAFSKGADFSGMDGTRHLMIQDVIHQAFVEVNEEGTEAAAATGVIVSVKSIPSVFRANRPFIFIIQQKDSGNILFLGRVCDPTK